MPAVLIAAGLLQTVAGAEPSRPSGSSAQSRGRQPAPGERLARQVLAISRLSPLDLRAAAGIVGSRLRKDKTNTNPHRRDWILSSTPLIAEAEASSFADSCYVDLVPQPSLALSLEDLEPGLLDLPYMMDYQRGHASVDSNAVVVEAIEHVFRVPAGELHLSVPTRVPRDAVDQNRRAIHEGFDKAEGKSRERGPINRIFITSRVRHDWSEPTTLRKIRQAENPPAQSTK